MVQLLNADQIASIKAIIQKRHTALILKVVGVEGLTPDERARLVAEGVDLNEFSNTIKDAYLFGQLQAKMEGLGDKTWEEVQAEFQKNPIPLSAAEQAAVQSAEIHAGAHIRHLGAKVEQQVSGLVFAEDARMRARILQDVQKEVAENIERRESIGKLKKELARIQPDWERDWNRVAITEKTNAMNRGTADAIRTADPEAWVYKQPMPDACPHCIRLHIGPDGHPRIFRLSTLEANGTNVGKKTNEWNAVVGTTHPHCQCALIRVPEGWGFDDAGDLVPGGTGGVREELKKALHPSIGAADSPMGDRAVQGSGGVNFVFQVPIHNAGGQARAKQAKEMKAFLASYVDVDREKYMIQIPHGAEIYNLDRDPPEPVHPLELPAERLEMAQMVLDDTEENRALLETQQKIRSQRIGLNLVEHTLEKAKGALFIGPRGGLWADPQHTIPYKSTMVRTPVRPANESKPKQVKPRKWKNGVPPGIPEPSWSSIRAGERGGTEELHWDAQKLDFKPERKKLHNKIVQSFLDKGAKHKKASGVAPTAIISMGGPASGKSTLLKDQFGDLDGYVRVDSDAIKEQLPEYQKAVEESYKSAAAIVHTESTMIAGDLLAKAAKSKKNLIFDTTGADFGRFEKQLKKLQAAGYRIAVVMPYVDHAVAVKRAQERGEETGRWIPAEAIRDVYDKVPKSFVQALPYAHEAHLYDNTSGEPKPIYEKSGDKHAIHNHELALLFPGLPDPTEKSLTSPGLDVLRGLAARGAAADALKKGRHLTPDVGLVDVGQIWDWVSLQPLE